VTNLSISHEDLAERWSLSFSDIEFVTGKPTPARLGLAVQLKYFAVNGFFVQDRGAIPVDGVAYLAEQLGFDVDTIHEYDFAVRGDARYPSVGLGVEIVEVPEAAGGKEVVADITNGALDAALLVAPGNGDWTGIVTTMGGKGEQSGVEADGLAMTLKHSALQIVVEHDLRNPAPSVEGLDVAGQKRLHSGIQEEAQE
jgi:hypothetical protein